MAKLIGGTTVEGLLTVDSNIETDEGDVILDSSDNTIDLGVLPTGSNNGLDADLLDGNHAGAFALDGHNHDGVYILESGDTMSGVLTLSDGSTAASQSWVNSNADVPNADYADSAGDADTVDGEHATAFADSGHTHDGRYYTESEVDTNFATSGHLHDEYIEHDGTVTGTLEAQSGILVTRGSSGLTANNSIEGAAADDYIGLDTTSGATGGVLLGYYNAPEVRVGNGNLSDFNWNGDTVATRAWTEANADVPNADYADSAGDADTVDGEHATAFADSGHTHDSQYVMESGDTMNGKLSINSGGLDVEGSTHHAYAGIRAGSNANNGHLMLDSNGGNLYLNWEDGGDVRVGNGGGIFKYNGDEVATQTWVNSNEYSYWTIEEGDGEQTNINSGQKLEIYGGTDINTEVVSTGSETRLRVSHNNTSGQGDVTTGGATVIDDIYIDGQGHVTNLNTQNRTLDDWGSASGSLNIGHNDLYNVGEIRDGGTAVRIDDGNNRVEIEDSNNNRTDILAARIYLEDGAGWFDGNHNELVGVGSHDHHNPANQDVDSVDGYHIQKNGTDGSGIINFKT